MWTAAHRLPDLTEYSVGGRTFRTCSGVERGTLAHVLQHVERLAVAFFLNASNSTPSCGRRTHPMTTTLKQCLALPLSPLDAPSIGRTELLLGLGGEAAMGITAGSHRGTSHDTAMASA